MPARRLPWRARSWLKRCAVKAAARMAEATAVRSPAAAYRVAQSEVDALHERRRSVGWPKWLVHVGQMVPCTHVLEEEEDGTRSVVENENAEKEGPWTLDAAVRGGEDTPYDRDIRVRLTISDAFPEVAPALRVRGIITNLFLHENNTPFPMFYHECNYPKGEDGYDITTCLFAAHKLFSKPLAFPPEADISNSQLSDIHDEWKMAAKHDADRHATISRYVPMRKHRELFIEGEAELPRSWFDETFYNAVISDGSRDAILGILHKECDGAFSFPLFNAEFCEKLIEESENYQNSGLPVRRPNSMNAYGLIVNEIGLEGTMDHLQQQVLWPIARTLFPIEGCRFDGHHSFLVHYKIGEDLGLDMHTDDSDVTFNVCLGKEFEGAGLTLCGVMGEEGMRKMRHIYQHRVGRCLVHLGRHRHGADDITSGERLNLIMWCHNYLWRKSTRYQKINLPAEEEEPDRKCLSYTHDLDYKNYLELTPEMMEFAQRAWYPPKR